MSSLASNWLSIELENVSSDMACWSIELRESFKSLTYFDEFNAGHPDTQPITDSQNFAEVQVETGLK